MEAGRQFKVKTSSSQDLISITSQVSEIVRQSKVKEGIANIFVLHTTCGITVNENADPDVVHDLLFRLDKIAPVAEPNDRHMEGNSAAHLKSSLLGCSANIPVKDGSLVLGTWQGIFLGEFDGPRQRTVQVTIFPISTF